MKTSLRCWLFAWLLTVLWNCSTAPTTRHRESPPTRSGANADLLSLESTPDGGTVLRNTEQATQAQASGGTQELDAAMAEAKKALQADEHNVSAMVLLARLYSKQGKPELARLVLENARAIDANHAPTHNALGLTYLDLKQRSLALASFQKAAELDPSHAEALTNFGALLLESQDFDGAVRALEAACASAPDLLAAQLNLGNAYRGKQQLDEALAHYETVLRLRPQLPEALFNLGLLYLDGNFPSLSTSARLQKAMDYLRAYQSAGGRDERANLYLKDASKALEKEARRLERERKEALKKATPESTATPSGAGQKSEPKPAATKDAKLTEKAKKTKKKIGAAKPGPGN